MLNHNSKFLLQPQLNTNKNQMTKVVEKFLPVILLLSILLVSDFAQAANITVSSSRNPVSLDDSFHLIYEADSNVDGDPDFSPIYQHFDVLSSSQSTNMRSVNGSWSLKKTWDLAVIAKDIGTFIIPAISFGSDVSPAIQITITNSTSSNRGASGSTQNNQATIPAELYIEASVDKKEGWIQSQFIYTVRLFRTVNLVGASITEPSLSDPDAIIEAIGEDDYQSTRNGIRYNVFERKYAIFPQKSGTLKINPVTFEGRVQATQPRSIFDQFRMSGQLKRLRSDAVSINVKSSPSQINLQDWLPASNLNLTEDWSGDINNIQAGEPITRTITIAAEGLTAVQLPTFEFENIQNLKQYPDKAVVENRPSTTGITGLKQIKIALIPAKAGSYTIPEIKLEWWNTTTNKKEVATLPESVLTVTGTVKEDSYSENTPVNNSEPITANPEITANNQVIHQETGTNYWKWISVILAIAWLLTLLLLFKRPKKTQLKTKNENSTASTKSLAARVKRYIKNEDPQETKISLVLWAQVFYSDDRITNLSQITQRCSAPLGEAIKQLDEYLYSPANPDWQSKQLLSAFEKEQSNIPSKEKSPGSSLKSLYNN